MESKHSLRKSTLFRTLLILLFMAVPVQWAVAQLTLSTPRTTLGIVIKGRFYKFNLSLANSQNLIKATANVILLSQI